MTKIFHFFRHNWGYLLVFAALIGLVFVGSLSKETATSSINMSTMASSDYQVTADQLTELYVVASVSSAANLASTDAVASNYVIVSTMQEIGQNLNGSIAKPTIVDTSNFSSGVIVYTVEEGDTMESIAATISGLTTDQIRWSNGLVDTAISPGDTLYLPSVPGIVYTVKAGDTLDSIVATYGSTKEQIISANSMDDETVTEGMKIVLPGGTLPETQRPEYVPPVVTPVRQSYTYTYMGSTWGRQNLWVVNSRFYANSPYNPYVAGQCTWYAWYWRSINGMALPSHTWGNARTWASRAAAEGYTVSRVPRYGAVFHTTSGGYGHVGIVVGVNSDGSITVREMNYGQPYRVTEATIPASQVGNYNYIY